MQTNKSENSLNNFEDITHEIDELRHFCITRWPQGLSATHSIAHWDRVALFARMLYKEGADKDVIMAFAYLHDSERHNDGQDIHHGKRASKLIDKIRHTYLKQMSDEQIAKLKKACELHTIAHKTGDITIDLCFDSDRMDLPRVEVEPLSEHMATKQGAEKVASPQYMEWYKLNFDNS